MKEILPIIIICSVGLVVCFGLLILIFVRFLRRKTRGRREEFEMDESTLTIKLNKKDLRKKN